MKTRLTSLILGTLTGLVLLVSNPLTAFASMGSMHDMMPGNQCQSSCGTQQTPVGIQGVRHNLKDEENEPQPTEPYYLAFIGVGWSTLIVIAAAYLLKYLPWRPPDLIKLHAVYRF